ncbi:MAG: hypothetical protein ACRDHZ_11350, partial [Ktedonobacteraceae bacterium]
GPTYILQEDPDYPENMKGVRCFKHAEHGPLLPIASSYIIDNLPFIKGAGTEVTVNIVNEKIEYVKMRFLEAYSSSFLTALSEKYGNPSTSKNTVYQNGFGESFDGITATWTMPDAVLTFTQYDGDKDWGRVELMSNSYRTQLNKAYDSSMQNIKDKM